MKKLLVTTIALLGIFVVRSSPAIAQSSSGFIHPSKTVVVQNEARYGGMYQWEVYNHLSKPVNVRIVIDGYSYSINGRSYKPWQPAFVVLPPNQYTPIKINLKKVGAVPIRVEIKPY